MEAFKNWQFEDPKSAQFIECFLKKANLFENGNFNLENVGRQLKGEEPSQEFIEKIKNCINDSLESTEKAFQGFICFKENNLYKVRGGAKQSQ